MLKHRKFFYGGDPEWFALDVLLHEQRRIGAPEISVMAQKEGIYLPRERMSLATKNMAKWGVTSFLSGVTFLELRPELVSKWQTIFLNVEEIKKGAENNAKKMG